MKHQLLENVPEMDQEFFSKIGGSIGELHDAVGYVCTVERLR